ncbi:hypothetical protein CRE_15737 [Caenorhabditis remanei]|uniref:Uncharacterized protein n=1 Tax=Caenorhabditis remanei TaxID=31234 RepID=E3NFC1_CAERE|nr:hypothetical protein CRE_15737 [Caenorhabditis remanei]
MIMFHDPGDPIDLSNINNDEKIVETSDNKSLKTILRILHFFLHESNIPKFTAGVTVLSSIPLVVFEKLELVEWYGVVMSSAKSSIFLIALFDILVTFLLGKGLQDTIIKVFDTPAFRIEVRTSFNTTLECTDVLDLECKTTAISRPARKNNFIGRGKPDEIAEFTLFEDSLQGKGKVKMLVKFRTDKRSGFFQVTLKYLLCVNYVFFRVFETKIYSTGNKLTKVSVKKESTFEDLLKHGSDTFLDENKLSKWMTVVSEKFELMMPDRENN